MCGARCCLLQAELPSAALLDVNLGDELVTPVAEFLQARNVPFAVASAYPNPKQYGGSILAEARAERGKPTSEQRLLRVLGQLMNDV